MAIVTDLIDRIQAKTEKEFEKLPDEVGTLYRVNWLWIECYLYNDLLTKSPLESMTHCELTDGQVVLSLGKEMWPPISQKEKCIRHALWKFLHDGTIWFVYGSDLFAEKSYEPTNKPFEKIVFDKHPKIQ